MNRSSNKTSTDAGSDDVEEMLREAEDAMLLKLSVNSHMARDPSSDLPPDLTQRFNRLKSGSSTSKAPRKSTKPPVVTPEVREEQSPAPVEDDGDDLLARFAALKASLPKQSDSDSAASGLDLMKEEVRDGGDGDSGGEHEDEVDKIIRWAVDAARLDPSPESDDDVDEDDKIDSDCDSSNGDSDDDDCQNRKKNKQGSRKR